MNAKFENLKGTYDYLPEQQIIREKIKAVLRPIFEKYGFSPVETPIICGYDLLASKYSEGADILNEMYKLSDQGKRKLGLRYDLTITFSKLVSSNPNITFPFKRYEMGRVYRDGPVKLGRNREFTQCDVDVVGTKSIMAEAEYMLMTVEAYNKLGLDIEIEFNNRKLLSGIISSVLGKIGVEKMRKCIMLIDKFAKLSKEELTCEFAKIDVEEQQFDELMSYFSLNFEQLKEKLSNCGDELVLEGIAEIEELYKFLNGSDAIKYLKFAPYLARGIDVYTGMVWEVFLRERKINNQEFNVSIGGGGRYDKIITTFVDDGSEYPAVGMSFGLDVIYQILVLKNQGKKESIIDMFIIPFGTETQAFALASKLREREIKVDIEKNFKKLKKSMAYANKINVPFVIILGEDEVQQGIINVKDMTTGQSLRFEHNDIDGIQKLFH